ncbi:MAG: serine/threonine protein kinase [Alphaproteobacteria bacterium]|nr:serine/threonine protein kinase [Alphaproteobacteria bacterium]
MRQRQAYRPPPTTLADGRYQVGEVIGAGGMATVYRVFDHHERVDRAAKILKEAAAHRTKTRSRFLTEARTMANLNHPHIVSIYDVGDEDDYYYFVMELAEGGALSQVMRRLGSLPARTALRYAFEALSGLEHAHRAGVVHRDVKPHNILLTADDAVRLTDFGIARILSDASAMRITGTGDMLGTLAYMAPEQRLDPRKVGPQADLYSVGALLYLAITGRRPIELGMGKLDEAIFERLPEPVRPVVRRATAHRAEDRYPTAREMAGEVAMAMSTVDPTLDVAYLMDVFDEDEDTVLAVRDTLPTEDA